MIVDVDKIVVSLDVVAPDAVVVEASAVLPIQVISNEEIPDISPLQIVDYGNSSIECAFDVTTEQAEEVVRGVLCGTINPPTFDNADYRLLHGQGSMDLAFAGLRTNTEYYLRPYALSNLGYKYGDVVAQRTKANPIPDEYQLVEYLESSGVEYLTLSENILNSKSIIIEFEMLANGSQRGIFGSRYGSGGTESYALFVTSNQNQIRLEYAKMGYNQYIYTYSTRTKYLTEINAQTHKYIVNGISYIIDSSLDAVLRPLYLFASYVSSLIISPPMRVYRFEYGDNKYYPVYRKADNKPGMYDIVNNVFYTNQGTGEFQVGPDKEWEE